MFSNIYLFKLWGEIFLQGFLSCLSVVCLFISLFVCLFVEVIHNSCGSSTHGKRI